MQRSGFWWEHKILKYVLVLESSISASFLRVGLEGQFAMAVRIPQKQCEEGGFTLTNYYTAIKNSIGEQFTGGIYSAGSPPQIIAARPKGLHAELRLLQTKYKFAIIEKQSVPVKTQSVLHKLKVNKNDCIVFYSFYSPCLDKCMTDSASTSIVDDLLEFDYWPRSQTAFVFNVVYDPSKSDASKLKSTKAEVSRAFDFLNGLIPLYRCNAHYCQWCGRNNVNEHPCLDDY